MSNLSKIILVSLFCISLPGCSTVASAEPRQSLEDYYSALDITCTSDQDCVVQNVGNCCGYYPRCTHKDAHPDPKWVAEFCSRSGQAGICGFPKVDGCECKAGKCKDKITTYDGVEKPVPIM